MGRRDDPGTLAAGRLNGRAHYRLIAAGNLLAGLGLIVAGVSPAIGFAITAYLVGGLGNGLESTAARLLVQARSAPADQGRAFAAYLGFGSAAAVVGTVTDAILLQPLGPRLALELRGALSALPALCLVVLRQRRTPTL